MIPGTQPHACPCKTGPSNFIYPATDIRETTVFLHLIFTLYNHICIIEDDCDFISFFLLRVIFNLQVVDSRCFHSCYHHLQKRTRGSNQRQFSGRHIHNAPHYKSKSPRGTFHVDE